MGPSRPGSICGSRGSVRWVLVLALFFLLDMVELGECLFGDDAGDVPEGSLGFVDAVKPGSSMCHDNCNGHGMCVSKGDGPTCECYIGWGNAEDITDYRSPGCDKRVCPAGEAWASSAIKRGIDESGDGLISSHQLRECSNVGVCDRETGRCGCPYGYFGDACEKKGCPNDCSGHGRCLSMEQLAQKTDALPLSGFAQNDTYAEFLGLGLFRNGSYFSKAWDARKIYGCLCDSSWSVGLASGQRQMPEWFGPDCSLKHCPSGDDPLTFVNEENCFNKTAPGSAWGELRTNGSLGNLCHIDCANRGVCNYQTGVCSCFKGHYGHDCTVISALSGGTGGQVEIVPQEHFETSDHYRARPFALKGSVDDMGEYFEDTVPDN